MTTIPSSERHVCRICGDRADAAGVCERDGAPRVASADPLIGEDVAGYRIVELIGRGGMGEVYRAVQRSIGAQVAIKVLSHDHARDPAIAPDGSAIGHRVTMPLSIMNTPAFTVMIKIFLAPKAVTLLTATLSFEKLSAVASGCQPPSLKSIRP